MKSVNRFESNLLRILYSILGQISLAHTLPLMSRSFRGSPPSCLSNDAVDLAQQAIKKGCVSWLVQAGGWQTESFLRNGQIKKGRIWERTSPENLGLTFSAATMDFLVWLTNSSFSSKRLKGRNNKTAALTIGDEFFLFLTVQSLHHTEIGTHLLRNKSVRQNGLIRLAFPELFPEESFAQPDYHRWTTGVGAAILESMQNVLTNHWQNTELSKHQQTDRDTARKIGISQTETIETFVQAANQSGRSDLYRFLLVLLSRILNVNSKASDWTQSLNMSGIRMADRMEIQQAVLAVPMAARLLKTQHQSYSDVSYIDEDYQASQLWKQSWEENQCDQAIQLAENIIRETTF